MRIVNALVPAGKTPLTSGVEQAAEALNFRSKPGVVVVVTDGEETCGRSPCELAKQLHLTAARLTIHVIGFRYEGYSWTGGGNSVMELMCLAETNNGLYIKANSEEEACRGTRKDPRLSDDFAGWATLRHVRITRTLSVGRDLLLAKLAQTGAPRRLR